MRLESDVATHRERLETGMPEKPTFVEYVNGNYVSPMVTQWILGGGESPKFIKKGKVVYGAPRARAKKQGLTLATPLVYWLRINGRERVYVSWRVESRQSCFPAAYMSRIWVKH